MTLHLRSCLYVIVLSVCIQATQSNENETDTNEGRRGRVYGRIVKLYSGIKPDPILCDEEGFKADPADCSTFYRCVQSFGGKFNVFKFQCGPGTVYDPATEVCNHPSNTKRSECRPILPVQQEVHENDIDYRELPSPISTIAPMYLNPKINASEAFTMSTILTDKYTDIRNSTTSYNTLTTANQQFSEAFGYFGSSWSNKYTTSSQVPSLSTKPSRSENSDPCTNDGFIGDSYDCKKFYRCVNNFRGGFIRYEFKCGESTVWDDDKQSCNYAWAVRSTRCGRESNEDNIAMSVEHDKSKVTSNPYYTSPQSQNENIVTNNPNAINYGDKINNYYNSMTSESPIINSIQNNKPQITNNYNDGTTQHYNENIITEKHPAANHFTEDQYNSYNPQPTENQINYGVTESHSQIDEVKKDFNSHTTSTEHAPSSVTRENDSSKLLNNMCLQTGFIGDPNDCQKFYRCVDSGRGSFTRYDFSCSQGTVWDSSIEACNHAWAVEGCGSKMATQGLTTESNAIIPSSSMNVNEGQDNEDEDTDNEYGYMNQINQENTKTTTPKIETTFSLPATSEGPSFGKSCSESGLFKNTLDCKKFYKCIENGRGSFTRFDYNCGEGTLWDETIEACNHAWAVKSCKTSSNIHNDTLIITTVTLVQTTTQKYINTDDYDSMYGLKQSIPTSDTAIELTSTTSKETLISNNRQCNRNGFMGDKEDCNKFYRCVDNGHNGYIRYEFSCGDGTVWDPTIEACNHAREVEDCRSSSSNNIDDNNQEPIDNIDEDVDNGYVTPSNKDPDNSVQTTVIYTTTPITGTDSNSNICKSPGFIGDSESCEKFYRCVDNGNGGFSRIEFSCGEGTVWDSSIEACNHRWAVEKCGNGANNEFSETTSQSIVTTTIDMSDSTTKASEESHTTTQQQPIHSDNKCTSEGFFGMESEDCKKFYRCVDNGKGGYTKYEFSCGDGTIWDESIQACNHASSDMTCGKGTPSSTYTPGPDSTSTFSTNSMPTSTLTSTVYTDTPSHDDQCTSEGFMADSSDCKKFYRCVDNGKGGLTKFEFSCGEGTVWIQEIQACDHDTEETNCNISKSTTMKSSTTTAEELTTSSTQGSTDNVVTATTLSATTTENNNINKNEDDKCSSEGFHPNKNDCKRFYRCVDDGKGSYTKYDFTCAEGTAWDIHSQSCNYIDQASGCQNNKIPQTGTKPDSEDNSESVTQENTTTTKPLSTTTSTRPEESTCEEEGFFGDTEDCKKFYRCVSNEKEGFTKYDFTCGDGTIWDKDITACNHPQDVSNPSCKSDGSTSSSSSTSTATSVSSNVDYTSAPETTSSPTSTASSPTSTSSATSTSSPTSTSSATATTSTTADVSSTTTKDTNSNCSDSNKDNTNNNNYTCTKAGFYADPNDCKKFYRCVDWENNGEKFSIFHFDCGDGTIWDPELETCNHEESVYPPRNCNGSQQQNQNNTESSSTTDMPSETESTTSIQQTTTETETTTTTTKKPTTQSKPTTTTQKSTTQSKPTTTTQKSTTQSKPTTTTTTTQKSTTQESTTTTMSTTEPSTQQTSTTSREESTTDSSTQSTTEVTVASNTDQTTTNKESTTSETTTTSSYETTAMTNQMSSTTEQSTTEVTTSTEEISPQTTDSQSSTTESTTTTNSQESTTEGSSSNKDCPETEDDQYLYVCPTSFKRHPKYCNMFYQCTDDNDNHEVKVAVFNCPNNTIYDESKTQCVEENKADKKCNGQISQRKRIKRLGLTYNEPVVVSRDSMACSSAGHFPFEKHEKCSPALLKCEYSRSGKLKGFVYKCPEGFVYWTISRRCEAIRKVKDCKRSSYPWDKRYDVPVERHNISL